jgi:hypothetical protein
MPDGQPSPTVMARVIGDEIARRDINTIRELRVLAEVGLDRRIDERVRQIVHNELAKYSRMLEQRFETFGKLIKDYHDHHLKALDERLQSVGHFVGEWKSSAVYHRGQSVRYNGGLWYCTVPTTNLTPNEYEPTWQLRCRGMPDEEIFRLAHNGNGNGLAHADRR